MDNQKNLLLAIAIAMGILVLYQVFVTNPEMERQAALREAQQAIIAEQAVIPSEPVMRSVEAVRAESVRINVANDRVRGSLSLNGARIDDLYLRDHYNTVEAKEAQDEAEQVELLRPRGSEDAFYALIGWGSPDGSATDLPGLDTPWRLVEGDALTPETPVTLEHRAGGLVFRRVISLDDQYMFAVTETVTNESAAPVTLAQYGQVRRHGLPADVGAQSAIVHEGGVGVVAGKLLLRKFKKMADGEDRNQLGDAPGGWAGLTDKYWLTAVIPDQAQTVRVRERAVRTGPMEDAIYEATFEAAPTTLAVGQSLTATAHIFAGAKEYDALMDYQRGLGVDRFVDAIDWGNFWFFTRPFFWALAQADALVGNFGVGILIVVVFIKLLFFPIANKAYASMAMLKKIQPRMKELQEKYKDDRERLQKEMMALYRTEKVNPIGGCLPILLQIPVFFALYKTISVTLEMRHEPFFGWVKDLSAPDPTHIGNLFGLIPWDPTIVPLIGPMILGIGVWPIIMGVTMWMVQALNPPPPDPMQARIFGLMPIFFTFLLGSFAVGLVIYWAWNNILSLMQQYIIMRRHKVDTQFDKLIARIRGNPRETEG